MNKIISVFLSFLLVLFNFQVYAADTATLLPDAVQQYFDNNGNPLSSGKVYFYIPSTTTPKTVWQDAAEGTVWANPVPLNAAGRPNGDQAIYGFGIYRQILKDKNNNTIWDRVTTSTGSGGNTPSAVGDGNLVGTILPWSGLIAPNQYVFGYGQEISRSGFPVFFTAITQSLNVICTSSSNTLTGIADTTQIRIGSPIELNLCVVPGTTVVSKTTSTVVLSNPSTISINSVGIFFPWGNGNGTTTFNVPDLRGYALAGRTNMGGTASSNLTSTYFGTGPDALGAKGGNQTYTLLASNVPPLPVLGTGGGSAFPVTVAGTGLSGNGGSAGPDNSTRANFGVTAQPFSIVQPSITINYIVKVTPDTSTSIATGVYSIGGMQGVIACGTGILCTGNIISVTGSTVGSGVLGNMAYYDSATSVAGNLNANISNGLLSLGIASTTIGQLKLFGNTSGNLTITPQATAGTPTWTAGTSSGTPAVTASSPLVITTATGNIACATCVTSSGGGAITGTAPVAVSAAGAVSITGAAGQVLAGASPAFTSTPVLGASGTLGSLGFGNATSGIVTLQPVAGALGTITVSIPSAAGTMAVSASSPLALNATTGALTCTGCLTNTPAALTKADDTNVTLTLGGTPATALLQAVSITAGWTGRLALSRFVQGATNTVLLNATSGTADFTAQNVASCDTATKALQWTTNTGFACNSSITANTVTTNANLTGVITSVGNATSIASQTGTGTKFVVDTSPTIITPSFTTGFTIGGSATSANYARGNGSNFVSSAIQAGDLPLATNAAIGGMRGDTTTISCTAGVCTAVSSAASSIGVASTTIASGVGNGPLTNNSSVLGNVLWGQLPGIASNTVASAGNVGELISNSASGVAQSSGVDTNITSVSLTAGDWNCWGGLATNTNGNITGGSAWISATSATDPSFPNAGAYLTLNIPTGFNARSPIGIRQIIINATTTIYLSTNVSYTVSNTDSAFLACRRQR